MLETELPQILAFILDLGLAESRLAAGAVPALRLIDLSCVETQARELVGYLARIVEVPRLEVLAVQGLFVLRGTIAVPLEPVRNRDRAERARLVVRSRRNLRSLRERVARFLVPSREIQDCAKLVVSLVR